MTAANFVYELMTMNTANGPQTANSDQIASIGSYDECEGIRGMNDVNIYQWHVFID